MTKILLYILLYFIISSILSAFIGWHKFHKPENSKRVEESLNEFSRDFNLSKEESYGIMCLGFVLLGFISLPVFIVKKIVKIFTSEQ